MRQRLEKSRMGALRFFGCKEYLPPLLAKFQDADGISDGPIFLDD